MLRGLLENVKGFRVTFRTSARGPQLAWTRAFTREGAAADYSRAKEAVLRDYPNARDINFEPLTKPLGLVYPPLSE